MYLLFLFIHLIFSGLFYLFDRTLESVLFAIGGLIFFFAFGPFDFRKKDNSNTPKIGSVKVLGLIKENSMNFLRTGTYYLGFFFFYLSFYGIAYSLAPNFDISVRTLYGIITIGLSSSMIVAFYSLRSKSETVCRVFRSNAFVFGTLHFFLLLIRLYSGENFSDLLFFLNVAVSLTALFTVALFDTTKDVWIRKFSYVFFLTFSYVSFVVFSSSIFETDLLKTALFILLFESIAVFDGLTRIRRLREFRSLWSYMGAIWSYICVVGGFSYVIVNELDFFILTYLAALAGFQLFLHAKYENYLSFLSLLWILWFLYFQTFLPSTGSPFFPYFGFVFALPVIFSLVAKIKMQFWFFDKQFLYGFSLFHSFIFFVAYFYRFSDYQILEISLLSLGFSALLFSSFLGMRK